jgi:hypothetical protein
LVSRWEAGRVAVLGRTTILGHGTTFGAGARLDIPADRGRRRPLQLLEMMPIVGF